MKSTLILFASGIAFFITSLQAYIILDSKTEVSPGCDGGVLSHECSSWINHVDPFIEPSSFDEHLESCSPLPAEFRLDDTNQMEWPMRSE